MHGTSAEPDRNSRRPPLGSRDIVQGERVANSPRRRGINRRRSARRDRRMAQAKTAVASPRLDSELARNLLSQMMLIRRFEEKAAEMYALGKIGGFLHLYIGQ